MKFKWIRSNRSCLKFILSLALVSLIIGFILFHSQSIEVREGVVNRVSELSITLENSRQNSILFHLALLSILTILSLIIIGMPASVIYYFYEFVSIGYLLASLFKYKSFTGLLFGCTFVVLNKFVFLVILGYFLINTINYTRHYIKNLKSSKKDIIINYLYKCFFTIAVIFINDIILYFIGNKLSSFFIFLL